jgi:hypothetical protein
MLLIDLRLMVASNLARNPKLLPDGVGVDAQNLDPSEGDFRGMRAASTVHTIGGLGSQQISAYRLGRDAPSDTAYWITSSNDVDVVRSLLASDPAERTYYTGEGRPKYTTNATLGSAPYTFTSVGPVDLGVPYPPTGFSVAVAVAGTGPDETRVYTDTFKRSTGDESGPNTTSATIVVPGGSTVDITSLSAVPSGSHGISTRSIYVSTSGSDFRECVNQTAATTTATDDGVTRGAILQTGGSTSKPAWLPPDDSLIGIIELWNGMHGAFLGKAIYTCVPYFPHAWPVEHRRALPDTIVGTATFGENWVIVTTGKPRVANASAPLGMTPRPINLRQGGVSKRSVKGVGHGVCWASNDGLCYYGENGAKVLTKDLLTKAQWRALVPSTIIGASWGGWYIGFYNDGTRKGFMIDPANPVGIIWLTQGAYGVFEDSVSETLFLLDTGNTIKKWDSGSVGSATFKSKVYRHPGGMNPGAARIVATTYPVLFSLWADGVLKVNAQSIANDEPFRIPGGYWAEEFQVQVSGTGPLEGVFVGSEIADLP